MIDDVPRRHKLYEMTPAERAIFDAVQLVETMGADVRLTDAVILLAAARDSVADYVDGINRRRRVREELEATEPRQQESETTLRDCLWVNHGCSVVALYGDDGERQCSMCGLDFKRMPLVDLIQHLLGSGRLHVSKLEATEPRPPAAAVDLPRMFLRKLAVLDVACAPEAAYDTVYGDIDFDWLGGVATVSASVGESGAVAWASLIDKKPASGKFQLPDWSDEFTEVLAQFHKHELVRAALAAPREDQ